MSNNYNNRSNGGYNNNGGGNQQRNNQNQSQKKHTGCEMKDSYRRNGGEVVSAPVIYGWNYRRSAGGLSKFVAVPNKDPKTSNPRWLKFVVTITPPGMSAKITTTGFWDVQKQRLLMPDMDMIANPKAPNGGYWGRNYRTKN